MQAFFTWFDAFLSSGSFWVYIVIFFGKVLEVSLCTLRIVLSRQAVSRWESGDVTPTMDKLKALTKIYDVSLDWLCNEDESEEKVVGQKEADKEPKHNKKKSATMIVIAVLLAASIIVSIGIAISKNIEKTENVLVDDVPGEAVSVTGENRFPLN